MPVDREIGFCPGCNALHSLPVREGLPGPRDPGLGVDSGSQSCPDCGQLLATAPPPLDLGISTTLDGTELDPTRSSRKGRAPGARPVDPLANTDLGGYRIETLAGRGGMARVYRARHLTLGRACAIKILDEDLAARAPSYVDQFLAEARSAAALVHPNIVTVHNVAEVGGRHLIEMEWVEGTPLGRTLVHRGSTDPAHVARVMVQVAAGLGEAHARGVVHRDVKPSNVLLGHTGVAKLADFGLAKRIHVGASTGSSRPSMAGTPYFMAPELFVGQPASPRSDVYAASVTLFYLLTGALPFRARSLSELVRLHRQQLVPDVRAIRPGTPDRAARILARGLAKRPGDRFRDASELHTELRGFLGSLRDLAQLVDEALTGIAAERRAIDTDHYEVTVQLAGGRTQRVLVESVRSELSGDRLIRISSPCAPVDDSFLRRALEVNGRVDHGALAIQNVDGQPYFVMRSSYPWDTCDTQELRNSVVTIATEADQVEAVLQESDTH